MAIELRAGFRRRSKPTQDSDVGMTTMSDSPPTSEGGAHPGPGGAGPATMRLELNPPNDFLARRAENLRKPPPMMFAAIDVGTNSIHMVMAEISPDGDFQILGRDRDMVQLGKGGFSSHMLTTEAMEAGLAALKRFAKVAQIRGITKMKAVATSAVREARNGGSFVNRVRAELGLELLVITPEEEGRLIYLGARHAVDLGSHPDRENLIIDIGGGSVEIIVGNAQRARSIHSAKLGGSRLAELFMASDLPRRSEIKGMRRHLLRGLGPILRAIKGSTIVRCIGTSGAIKSLVMLVHPPRGDDSDSTAPLLPLSQEDLKTLVSRLYGMTRAQRLDMPGMDAKRVDACLPAATLLLMILEELGLGTIEHCDYALREGMIVDYIGAHRAKLLARATWPNPRTRSVVQLAERCQYRKGHAEQVARLASQLFDQLAVLHGLDGAYKELLTHACTLHDIGYLISHQAHHKHSYYLIRNGALKGFDEQEIEIIANIARYHRKERPKKSHYSFRHLDPTYRKPVRKLAVILRIANALDRTHYGVVEDVVCHILEDRVRLVVNPRHDAELEIWTTRAQAELFKREFERELVIELSPQSDTEVPLASDES